MPLQDTIQANTCPYCGAAYTLAAGGCVAQCRDSEIVKAWIAEWLDCEDQRDPAEGEP